MESDCTPDVQAWGIRNRRLQSIIGFFSNRNCNRNLSVKISCNCNCNRIHC